MKYLFDLRRTVLLTLACALMHGGVALAASKSAAGAGVVRAGAGAAKGTPADASDTQSDAESADDTGSAPGLDANVDASGSVQGDVADLMQLIHDGGLTEMRTTYNGGYGASLFFHAQRMTYYVALFQDKHFWRVIRTSDQARAESIYTGFARQTAQLADVEIRRAQLQAQKASIERVIGESQARAQRLQADIEVARAQEAKVADYQRQTQDETLALRDEKDKAQAELRQLQQQVLQLQRQAEAGLPGNR
ncbi:Protein of unknown function [Burkholderia sp. YR290]|jgi:hypothetical protein|uniref:DUF2968 domain-containing protein n=1 Tax=Paraburkholderia hospita TaxID=169430 RepID=UPI000271CF4E|nr:DUF2968 domain-containing protein [Paraburkholderia hospita]EUC17338.1 Protein of unknown function DUF2968 [Burkholderia sp. BT03]SKC77830.1 Protein of unknown function [Paraburkholderia hospita]SKC97614.1 Protein of unknown function [Paraburkholderia hospita]SOE55154.1 Protein of unknown function [Burkholderia sp. YR290]